MLRIRQERNRCETKYIVFEHFYPCVNLNGRLLSPPMHRQVLYKNLNLFIVQRIQHLIPFPQITTLIKFIQNCDEHNYFKVYLQRYLFSGCKTATAIGILRPQREATSVFGNVLDRLALEISETQPFLFNDDVSVRADSWKHILLLIYYLHRVTRLCYSR